MPNTYFDPIPMTDGTEFVGHVTDGSRPEVYGWLQNEDRSIIHHEGRSTAGWYRTTDPELAAKEIAQQTGRTLASAPQMMRTVNLAYDAINYAAEVQILVRFGVSEGAVRITKTEARRFLDEIEGDPTPEAHEMYTDSFATYYPATQVLVLG